VIMMSETLYNVEYYPSLFQLINFCLNPNNPDACVIAGTKTFYYGLGGGYIELISYLNENPSLGLVCETLHKVNDLKSIERLVLRLYKGQLQQ